MEAQNETRSGNPSKVYDALIIGAGFSGLEMLRHARRLGLSVRVLEAGSEVGGTWYWNRYPGARTDCESWVYCYSHDNDLLKTWNWSQRYPTQEEMQNYLSTVADKNGYRSDISFDAKMESARYLKERNVWHVRTGDGKQYEARFLLTAVGVISQPYLPNFKGIETFKGDWYRTARWPKADPDFRGKRVGLVGVGATGVQAAPFLAEQAAHLTVFQRTPNYVIAAQNHDLSEKERAEIKDTYSLIWGKAKSHTFGLPYESAGIKAADVDSVVQQRVLEDGWKKGGFRFLFETFEDVITDAGANEIVSEFIRNKIRQTVKDPVVAERLCPKGYPFGGKRPPAGHGYYETFNRPNVTLVDLKEDGQIQEVRPNGIQTEKSFYELDSIVFATGFDGFTGCFTEIDIIGENGVTLREYWRQGARTTLGYAVSGFPNMLMIFGPQTPFANAPLTIECCAQWVSDVVQYMRDNGLEKIDTSTAAEDWWIDEVAARANETLVPLGTDANNWFAGANIPGKARGVAVYLGGLVEYSKKCQAEAAGGYPHFQFAPAAKQQTMKRDNSGAGNSLDMSVRSQVGAAG